MRRWIVAGITALAVLSIARAQDPTPSDVGLVGGSYAASLEVGRDWLNAAMLNQQRNYSQLLVTRGIKPPEQQIADIARENFPPDAGFLIYDYIPAWDSAAAYSAGDMVLVDGVAFRCNITVNADGSRPDKSIAWTLVAKLGATPGAPPLRIWLLSRAGLEAYATVPFTPAQLEQELDALQAAVGTATEDRPDHTRGIGNSHLGDVSLPAALASLGKMLIPGNFWRKLLQFR